MSSRQVYATQSQVFWTCKALLDGRSISHKNEIHEVRGWRLSSIIHNLKAHYGWPIVTEYRGPENVAYYSMQPGCDVAALRFPKSAASLGDGEAA